MSAAIIGVCIGVSAGCVIGWFIGYRSASAASWKAWANAEAWQETVDLLKKQGVGRISPQSIAELTRKDIPS
jgi:hypothetical protein